MSNIKDYIREVLSGRLDSDGSININLAEYNRLHKYFPRECLEVQTELVTEKVLEGKGCDKCAKPFHKAFEGMTRCRRCCIKYSPQQSSKKQDIPPPSEPPTPPKVRKKYEEINSCIECNSDMKVTWLGGVVLGCINKNCSEYWRRK